MRRGLKRAVLALAHNHELHAARAAPYEKGTETEATPGLDYMGAWSRARGPL